MLPETADDAPTCGTCGQAVDPRAPRFLLECHYCGRWQHGDCEGVSEPDAMQIAKFACGSCAKHGNSTVKFHVSDTLDMDELNFAPLPIQRRGAEHASASVANAPAHVTVSYKKNSDAFRRVLKTAVYARSGVHTVLAQDLNAAYLKHRPLEQPTLVLGNSHSAAGLNNPFPPVTAQDISRLLAAGCAVRGVDVENQMTVSLTPPTWGSWLQMLDTTPANAQFRVLETGFRHQVAPPAAVTAVDWHFTLPQNAPGSSSPQQVPNPNIFGCFMGMNTFQDFAIAPGGQNAWLSVSDGDLWVFLVPPSPANLRAYQQWQSPSSASTSADTHPARVFLAEHVDKCIKTVVSAGSTLLVPSGWLVALFADNNCSYFSGLFFSTSGLDKQLQIIMDHEQRDDRLGATWKETGWFAADTTAQTWAAITFSVRQLLIPDTTALVSEQDKAVLLRSLPLIRRWCASPLALKACDSLAWTPSSLAEAQDIVNRLEQALSMAMSHFGMAGLSNAADQHPTSSLPSITPTEANYIYSATGVNDGWPGVDAVNNFHASMPSFWGEFSPPAVDHMGTTAPDANNFFSNAFGGEFTSLGGPFMGHAGMGGVYFGDGMGNATTPPASAASTPMRQALDARGQLVDALVRHRASCHRCGNLRKKNVRCPKCPHIFCQKCAEKMVEEHGERIFADGCPVCKERCCCGKNRSTMCVRKYHCYKKCPSTKRPTA